MKKKLIGLPWLSGEETACQRRRHGFDPWSGKTAQAAEQLSPCATVAEPALQSLGAATTEPACCNSRSPWAPEATLCCGRRNPLTATGVALTRHS